MLQRRLPTVFLSLVLAFLPLVVWKGFFEAPKVYIFLFVGMVLTIWRLGYFITKRRFFALDRSDLFYFLWLSVLAISSLKGVHPLESFFGGSYRHQGVLFFLALWLVGKTVKEFDVRGRSFLERMVGLAVLLQSVIVFTQYLSGNLYFDKPLGTLGEANAVSGYLAIGSFFVLKNWGVSLIFLPITATALTFSKSGVLALLPNLQALTIKNRYFRGFFMGMSVFAAIIVLVFSLRQGETSLVENRMVLLKTGIRAVAERPLLGFGAESGEVVYKNAFESDGIFLEGLTIDRSHNLALDITIWSGLIGLSFFLIFLILRFRGLEKIRKLAFISFIIYSLFQPLNVVHYLLVFLL